MTQARTLNRTRKVLSTLFLILVISGTASLATFNYVAMGMVEVQKTKTMDLIDHYTSTGLNDFESLSVDQVSEFHDYVVYSPQSDDAVAWMLLESVTKIDHDDKRVEKVVRQALNRLEGFELYTYIRSLRDSIQGFRPDGYTDILKTESADEIGDKVRQSILNDRDFIVFSDSELSSLQACYDHLRSKLTDLPPVIAEYNYLLYMIFPEFLYDSSCALYKEISL